MARITIEDCIEKIPNRFQLVQMAAIRTKQLKKGARPLLSAEGNKSVVTSLREIAAGLVRPGEAEPTPSEPVVAEAAPARSEAPATEVEAKPEGGSPTVPAESEETSA